MTAPATSSGSASRIGDQCVLAAKLEHDGFTVSEAARITARPVGTLPISAIIATSLWPASLRPASLAAGHDIEHAGRQYAVDQFGEPQRGERRLFRRLHDHGIAGGERSGGLARAEHERMIEWDDAPDDAAAARAPRNSPRPGPSESTRLSSR